MNDVLLRRCGSDDVDVHLLRVERPDDFYRRPGSDLTASVDIDHFPEVRLLAYALVDELQNCDAVFVGRGTVPDPGQEFPEVTDLPRGGGGAPGV